MLCQAIPWAVSKRAVVEAPVIIKRSDNSLNLDEKAKFSITCSLSKGTNPVAFSWMKNNKPLYGDRVKILNNDAFSLTSLAIDKLESSDAGNYTCIAENTAGQDSHSLQLIIKQTLKWKTEPKDVTVGVGQDVSIECSATGLPSPTITWYTLKQSRRAMLSTGNNLKLNGVSANDAGMYECVAFNGVDQELRKTVKVSVNGEHLDNVCRCIRHRRAASQAPEIFKQSSDSFVLHEEEKFTLTCSLKKGTNPVQFTWTKDSLPLNDDHVKVRTIEDLLMSTIIIEKLKSSDAGNYTCKAQNAVGQDSHTLQLKIKQTPKWIEEPQDVQAIVGQDISVACSASGSPAPTITWSKPNRPNAPSLLTGNNLRLNVVSSSSAGLYECSADNGVDEILKKTIRVSVNMPAKFETKFAMITGKRGESVKLECPAQGDQPLSVTWMKDNVSFDKRGGDNYEIFDQMLDKGLNSELILRSVERKDSAVYKCTTKNDFGTDERTIKLVVLETPASPTNLRVKEVWSRSASLVWTAPFTGNSPISKYTIQYWRRQNAPHRLHEMTVSSTQTSAIIKDLQPGLSYEVTITAENDVGRGETSESVNFVTGQEEPSAAPVDVTAEARGSSTILVTWKPPPIEHWNGQIKGFYVGYKARDSQQPFSYRTVDAKHSSHSAQTYEFFLANLIKGSSYIVVVKAYNNAGSGPASHDIVVNLIEADLPTSPQLYVLGVRCYLRFAPLDNENCRLVKLPGDRIFYSLPKRLRTLDGNSSSSTANLDPTVLPADGTSPSTNTYTLKNLEGASRYNIYVTAKNRFGTGDPSNSVTVSTDGRTVQYPAVNANLNPLMGDQVPYFAQPTVMVPILCAMVVIVVVLLGTLACVKKMREYPPPEYADFNTMSKQFTYTGNAQPMLEGANMKANFPAPYATMTMRQSQETGDPWERPLPNPKSHIYDNPQ
ncbi:Down syndrome cell adhesion molecule-like protein 1 -like protein [Halotydeus destructor]|nr:Down syndrome cell adhesion molecule-like protein 1 -like protein [Halotydeus destructor]